MKEDRISSSHSGRRQELGVKADDAFSSSSSSRRRRRRRSRVGLLAATSCCCGLALVVGTASAFLVPPPYPSSSSSSSFPLGRLSQRHRPGLRMMAPPPPPPGSAAAAAAELVVPAAVASAPPPPPSPEEASALREERVSLSAIDINRRGEEGIPVLVLHGLLGSGRNFRSWASSLHDRLTRPRRVIVPDLRNHGSSPHVQGDQGGMSYREMASDVLALMDANNVERCVLVGHSMGGKVAAAAALSDSDRIAGLVVLDIAPVSYSVTDGTNWQDTHRVIEMLSSLPLQECGGDKGEADRRLQDMGLADPGMRAFALTNLEASAEGGLRWRINLEGIRRSLPQIAAFDVGGEDEEGAACEAVYPHKTLFLNGGNSKYLRTAHLSTISQLFPTFSLATIRGAGHWVHAEKPEETLQIVRRYLDEEMEV